MLGPRYGFLKQRGKLPRQPAAPPAEGARGPQELLRLLCGPGDDDVEWCRALELPALDYTRHRALWEEEFTEVRAHVTDVPVGSDTKGADMVVACTRTLGAEPGAGVGARVPSRAQAAGLLRRGEQLNAACCPPRKSRAVLQVAGDAGRPGRHAAQHNAAKTSASG